MVVDLESNSSSISDKNLRIQTLPSDSSCTLLTNPPHDPARSTLLTQIAPVTPHLYLAAATALTPEALSNLHVSLVINVTCELPLLPVDGAQSLRISVPDSPGTNLLQYFQTASDAIHREAEAGGAVLVHCVAGVSRSASLILAYLISHADLSLEEAWTYLRRIRPWVRPNHGFMEQLCKWEAALRPGKDLTKLPLPGAEDKPKKQRTQSAFTSQRKNSSLLSAVPDNSILKACS